MNTPKGKAAHRKRRRRTERRVNDRLIIEAWERHDDGDISTERLFAMVEDETGYDAGDISSAMWRQFCAQTVVYLRPIGYGDDQSWHVCAKGDPGAHAFSPRVDGGRP